MVQCVVQSCIVLLIVFSVATSVSISNTFNKTFSIVTYGKLPLQQIRNYIQDISCMREVGDITQESEYSNKPRQQQQHPYSVVLLTSDLDFLAEIKQMREAGIKVYLIYNQADIGANDRLIDAAGREVAMEWSDLINTYVDPKVNQF